LLSNSFSLLQSVFVVVLVLDFLTPWRANKPAVSPFCSPFARYAKHNANFVLVVSGSLKAESPKKVVEIVYNLLIKAIELGWLVLVEFGVGVVGLK
jgi:hypothetical protein